MLVACLLQRVAERAVLGAPSALVKFSVVGEKPLPPRSVCGLFGTLPHEEARNKAFATNARLVHARPLFVCDDCTDDRNALEDTWRFGSAFPAGRQSFVS